MYKDTLISKMIFTTAGIFTMLAVLTNCGSKAANSSDAVNTSIKNTAGSPVIDVTPVGTPAETAPDQSSKIPTVSYCELVQNAADYDRKIVRLRTIYFTGFEKTYFYDSRCEKGVAPEAPENVPAEMWAEWDKSLIIEGSSDEAKMNRQLKSFGRKDVTVIGRFYSTNEQNDRNAPNLFGHLNCCRFEFRIMRAESVTNLEGKTAKTVSDYGK